MYVLPDQSLLDIVRYIVGIFASRPKAEARVFLDMTNEYGNTALHWAALGGHLDAVKLLVETGASPALANDKNYVPLDLASFNNQVEVVDYFLAQSSKLESRNAEAGEALGSAADNLTLDEADEGAEANQPTPATD
jgi:ankyrin repeat protein